ncbi:MAG: S8 family serine peptidase [Telluria sp.]
MKRIRTAWLLALALLGPAAHAQLHLPSLPGLPLPQLQAGPLDTRRLLDDPLRTLPDVRALRMDAVASLLRRHRDLLEADPRGEPVVRRRLLAVSPSPAGMQAARELGLEIERRTVIEPLAIENVVLRVPEGADTAAALERLRARDPQGSYDFDHIYVGSGAGAGSAPGDARAHAPAVRAGLLDGGVDAAHPAFAHTAIERFGCDKPHPSTHGTEVAALLAGDDGNFSGTAPRAHLYAADIYCDSPAGGSAEAIATALGWLAREKVGVINLSVVGPPNLLLERAVAAMVRRGHLLVAAAGNDGPAAPPLYPASYPGVVGVSAIDRRGRLIAEAARGPQVMFAAPGSQIASAQPGGGYAGVRGTSFAAPLVAGLLAGALPEPDPARAAAALSALAATARPLDGAGRGVVAKNFFDRME